MVAPSSSAPGSRSALVANLSSWADDLPHHSKVVARLWLARAAAGEVVTDPELGAARRVHGDHLARNLLSRAVEDRYAFFPGDVYDEAQGEHGEPRPAPVARSDASAFADRLARIGRGMNERDRTALDRLTAMGAPTLDRIAWRVASGSADELEARVAGELSVRLARGPVGRDDERADPEGRHAPGASPAGSPPATRSSDRRAEPVLATRPTAIGERTGPVDVLVIGALKAATTSLAAHLRAHRDVFVPTIKELAFFTYEYNWHRGRAWYEACFADAAAHQVRCEASPHYAWWPGHEGVPERVARMAPDAKIVYVVRDPEARMASMYRQAVAFGGERRPFARAILETADYLDTSRYHTQLARWLACFRADQVLLITTEALASDPVSVMAAIDSFIGIDPARSTADLDVVHNQTPTTVPVPEDLPSGVRAWMRRALRPEVERIRRYLPADFDGWGIATRG